MYTIVNYFFIFLKHYKRRCRTPPCIQLMKLKIVTDKKMINNTITLAKYKLSQHRVQGTKSNLNIFEVAQLMDAIKFGDQIKNVENISIFQGIILN